MDEYQQAKLEGVEIFRRAIKYIEKYGWNHNSMDILLAVSKGERWPQPMAVLMFSELSDALGPETLSQFDHRVSDPQVVTQLFERVATGLTMV